MNSISKPAAFVQCEGGCEHTEDEHQAWDQGWMAGERNPDADNPFNYQSQHNLWEAWESGKSVGIMNRVGVEAEA